MKTQSENLSAQESLDIITGMIEQAKGSVQKNSFYFLLWGWVVVLANLAVFVLIRFTDYPNPFIVWSITIPAAIFSIIHGIRKDKQSRVSTHLEKISAAIWIGFGITCFTFIIFGAKIGWQINPVITIMCATPTFVSGVIIRFKPLMFGAITLWVLGVASFVVGSSELQFLLSAIAITLGYLVPGYMLRSHEN
ncbi:MAG TPA: hypothetical protein VGK59_11710 [Ohtaekwangia sp.]